MSVFVCACARVCVSMYELQMCLFAFVRECVCIFLSVSVHVCVYACL